MSTVQRFSYKTGSGWLLLQRAPLNMKWVLAQVICACASTLGIARKSGLGRSLGIGTGLGPSHASHIFPSFLPRRVPDFQHLKRYTLWSGPSCSVLFPMRPLPSLFLTPFLPRRVPDLQLCLGPIWQRQSVAEEGGADGGAGSCVEGASHVPHRQARLADTLAGR